MARLSMNLEACDDARPAPPSLSPRFGAGVGMAGTVEYAQELNRFGDHPIANQDGETFELKTTNATGPLGSAGWRRPDYFDRRFDRVDKFNPPQALPKCRGHVEAIALG